MFIVPVEFSEISLNIFSPEKGRKVLRRRTKRGYEALAEQDVAS